MELTFSTERLIREMGKKNMMIKWLIFQTLSSV